MTWSVLGRDPRTGELGIATASADPFAGAYAAFISPGVAATAVQSQAGPGQGLVVLRRLDSGSSPAVALGAALNDPRRELFQIAILDNAGRTACFTGAHNLGWAGHVEGPDCVTAGNLLAGPQVLAAAQRLFRERQDLPLTERLLVAARAAAAAGGDRRGHRSARLLVYGREEHQFTDIRVDDHHDSISELLRLDRLFKERSQFGAVLTRAWPAVEKALQAGLAPPPGALVRDVLPSLTNRPDLTEEERHWIKDLAYMLERPQPLGDITWGELLEFLRR